MERRREGGRPIEMAGEMASFSGHGVAALELVACPPLTEKSSPCG
jgi:hypothetical protein